MAYSQNYYNNNPQNINRMFVLKPLEQYVVRGVRNHQIYINEMKEALSVLKNANEKLPENMRINKEVIKRYKEKINNSKYIDTTYAEKNDDFLRICNLIYNIYRADKFNVLPSELQKKIGGMNPRGYGQFIEIIVQPAQVSIPQASNAVNQSTINSQGNLNVAVSQKPTQEAPKTRIEINKKAISNTPQMKQLANFLNSNDTCKINIMNEAMDVAIMIMRSNYGTGDGDVFQSSLLRNAYEKAITLASKLREKDLEKPKHHTIENFIILHNGIKAINDGYKILGLKWQFHKGVEDYIKTGHERYKQYQGKAGRMIESYDGAFDIKMMPQISELVKAEELEIKALKKK